MRITGGTKRGHLLTSPPDNRIRPTSDRARLAIFNMLESRGAVRGASVLDLFCGTGALGLEALSRGASSCLFIDAAKDSLDLTRKNAVSCGMQTNCSFLQTSLPLLPERDPCACAALVFMDPPYHQGLMPSTLSALARQKWIKSDAFVVVETEKGWTGDFPAPYDVLVHKTYGAAAVFLLQAGPY